MVNPDSKANPWSSTAPGDLIYTAKQIVHKRRRDPGADLNHNANIHTLHDSDQPLCEKRGTQCYILDPSGVIKSPGFAIPAGGDM